MTLQASTSTSATGSSSRQISSSARRQERAARLLGASTAAFERAAVVPQAEEAARAVRVRDGLSEHARAEKEGAELDRTSSVELGVASRLA